MPAKKGQKRKRENKANNDIQHDRNAKKPKFNDELSDNKSINDKRQEIKLQLQTQMGFGFNYIERAFRVFEKNYGNEYNLEVMIEIIVKLQNKDMQKGSINNNININADKQGIDIVSPNNNDTDVFVSHMNVDEAEALKLDDKIDHRDYAGCFLFATIVQKQGSNLKIHYDGWSIKWDTWSDYRKELYRFAKPKSISERNAHRFNEITETDYIDINPKHRHPGWKTGEIKRIDEKSGQVQVIYEYNSKSCLYWLHLDDESEVAKFTTKTGYMDELPNELPQIINNSDNAPGTINIDIFSSPKGININVNNSVIQQGNDLNHHTCLRCESFKMELKGKDALIDDWKKKYNDIKKELENVKLKQENESLKKQLIKFTQIEGNNNS